MQQEGEDCGPCLCPPVNHAGACDVGLECQRNDEVGDAPGKCVKSGKIISNISASHYYINPMNPASGYKLILFFINPFLKVVDVHM